MNKLLLTILIFTCKSSFAQDSTLKDLTKIKFDLQLFGNSPVFSAGLSKAFHLGNKALFEARLGVGFYLEFKDNKYPNLTGDYWDEKKEIEPAFSLPIEFTLTPSYKKRISFSIGSCYNFLYFNDVYLTNDPLSPQFGSFRHPIKRLFFSLGSDYRIKNKLFIGLRLLSLYDLDKGFAKPFILPFPSLRYKF